MNLIRKFLTAGILSLIFVSQSYSIEPYVPKPIPAGSFHPVIIRDPLPEQSLTARPVPKIPKPDVIVKVKPTPKPVINQPKNTTTGNSLRGTASWYCLSGVSRCTVGYPGGYYAAIRRDLLELRGDTVLVCASRCVRVKIIDCNCGPDANLIDLYWDAFNAIGNPSLGRMKVTISW